MAFHVGFAGLKKGGCVDVCMFSSSFDNWHYSMFVKDYSGKDHLPGPTKLDDPNSYISTYKENRLYVKLDC